MNLFKVRLDKFWLNALSLAKGTIAGQVLVISFMPVLTRLYKPSDFGVFAAVSGIIALLAAVSTMRLEQAIVLPKNDEEAWSLFKSSTSLAISFLIIMTLLLPSLFIFYISSVDFFILLAVIVSPTLLAIQTTLGMWANRQSRYRLMGQAQFIYSLVMVSAQVLFSQISILNGSSALLAGSLFGYCAGCFVLIKGLDLRNSLNGISLNINMQSAILDLKHYSDFPKYNLPRLLLNTMSRIMPTFLFTYMGYASAAGFFSMSYRVIGAPSSILSNAASRVNYQLNAEIRSKDKKMMPTLKDNLKKLILIGLPIFLTIYLTAPFLFGQIFGESWAEAGWYAQVLVPWLFVMFLTSPLAPILTVLKLQDVTLKYDVVLLIARVLAILAPIIIFDNIEMSVISFSIIGFMFNSWLLFFIFKTVKKYDEVYG